MKSLREIAWAENIKTISFALLIALVIRTFFFQPFNIPSGSMIPTLLIGDYLFVSKYSYGYSRHSFPFSPGLFDGRIMGSEPERGDIAVFKTPADNRTDFIKRVIGLPGDEIQMRDSILYINGVAVPRERIENFIERDAFGGIREIPQYRETLPNGVSYTTLDRVPNAVSDNTGVYRVPAGHYFMMGDNRDNSSDSRVPSAVGYVPLENFVGKAQVIFFSTDGSARLWAFWNWFSATRWERLFDGLD
ncbi:MAG: signal peptidase I [Alphaproteobacteria bacterium]|nr:signal peptidase I [Rhodobiaceae bacterium]MBO6542422.1 signal peptidase I [Alphaproteobacteria bacterium]MBO6628960.1 signal peptidase I [Alphaproteobacteria bacterium]MDF1624791.1 signal peptidase I [Parvibaculaceae bacterium]